ncbi:MAG: SMC family ATPase, partial [Peptococcaceae bacterium]|nr:SMC family ATPase [Peptococcaceae bacterium]
MSFETYVLVTYFLQVLEMANQRLLKMTGGRYYFLRHTEAGDKRKAAGLDLDIMDNYTGRARAVSSLSGGEGFKASLALALGLSDTVQHTAGGMELNTILIDEGFGTLDSESLESTIACLVELQQHGRLVGVISHVAELKEQIPAWLTVTATDHGSTARFVIKQ